jgi:hypothetical protein
MTLSSKVHVTTDVLRSFRRFQTWFTDRFLIVVLQPRFACAVASQPLARPLADASSLAEAKLPRACRGHM